MAVVDGAGNNSDDYQCSCKCPITTVTKPWTDGVCMPWDACAKMTRTDITGYNKDQCNWTVAHNPKSYAVRAQDNGQGLLDQGTCSTKTMECNWDFPFINQGNASERNPAWCRCCKYGTQGLTNGNNCGRWISG